MNLNLKSETKDVGLFIFSNNISYYFYDNLIQEKSKHFANWNILEIGIIQQMFKVLYLFILIGNDLTRYIRTR